MRDFVALYNRLDETTSNNAKVAALADYFAQAAPHDAAWALALLSGRRIQRPVQAPKMRRWAAETAGVPDWLFEESYDAVGDLSETIALLVSAKPGAPGPDADAGAEAGAVSLPELPLSADASLAQWIEGVLLPLRSQPDDRQRAVLQTAWANLRPRENFLLNKLIGGSFRVGVSQQLVLKALARITGTPEAVLAHRLMGDWQPSAEFYTGLFADDHSDADRSRPYPFYLAYALEQEPAALGEPAEWLAEYKWDGIRAQLIRRSGQVFLWSRGEELITERFPEIEALGKLLPDGTVLDGELMPWTPPTPDLPQGRALPFAALQRRIGRKVLSKKILDEVPVRLVAFDVLEWQGQDLREQPLADRRAYLQALADRLPATAPLLPSPVLHLADWDALAQAQRDARQHLAEGLMLKRLDSPYRTGRRKGDWWKWKVAPYSVDAVLVYAQRGTGRRASLYTDYTFAVWRTQPPAEPAGAEAPERVLVPFAKAYSGLTDAEIRRVDAWVRRHTLEKFGPVRTVTPELVFELAFEGLQASPRHKSGVAVRFPRILRWREDKRPEDADTLDTLHGLLQAHTAAG